MVRSSFETIFSKYKLQAGLSFRRDAVQIPLEHEATSLRDRCSMFRVRLVISSSRVEMSGPYHPATQRHIPEERRPLQVISLAY
jgi:hypothetical protein